MKDEDVSRETGEGKRDKTEKGGRRYKRERRNTTRSTEEEGISFLIL